MRGVMLSTSGSRGLRHAGACAAVGLGARGGLGSSVLSCPAVTHGQSVTRVLGNASAALLFRLALERGTAADGELGVCSSGKGAFLYVPVAAWFAACQRPNLSSGQVRSPMTPTARPDNLINWINLI
jgi:hypothetical protein